MTSMKIRFINLQVRPKCNTKYGVDQAKLISGTNLLFSFLIIYFFQYQTAPVVFVSKMLGMLPAIWTEEESESECKSYFNLYTFVIFAGG